MKTWLSVFLLVPFAACAAPQEIVVLGLFKDKAVLTVDGNRRVLARGQTSPEGVKLVRADSDAAVLEIEGKSRRYTLGAHIGAQYTPPEESVVRIWPDGGLYRTSGFINGRPVNFMVDTGASSVAMGEAEARRLGIDFRVHGQPHLVNTAGGKIRAYAVRLDTVRVGDIQLRNIDCSVLEGNATGSEVLLGMTYLGQLEMQREGEALLLRQKH